MWNDAEVQDAVRNLFLGVAPERKSELSELWDKYQWQFNFLENSGPKGLFVLDAGAFFKVRFNDRALRAFWLASFVAWDGYQAVAEGYESDIIDLASFRQKVDCFRRVLVEEDLEAISMPEGVPDPGVLPDGKEWPKESRDSRAGNSRNRLGIPA